MSVVKSFLLLLQHIRLKYKRNVMSETIESVLNFVQAKNDYKKNKYGVLDRSVIIGNSYSCYARGTASMIK